MIDPVEFDIERLANGKGYVVTGEITVAGRIAAEDFRQHCRTLKEANEHANEAALDMLEALKRALFILESPVVSPYCTPSTKAQPGTIEAVRGAIAKAEGR